MEGTSSYRFFGQRKQSGIQMAPCKSPKHAVGLNITIHYVTDKITPEPNKFISTMSVTGHLFF